jgi:DNA-binding response OmpR family regulator
MLTTRGRSEDVLRGLDAADDYLAKPFELPILLSRVRAAAPRRVVPSRGRRARRPMNRIRSRSHHRLPQMEVASAAGGFR